MVSLLQMILVEVVENEMFLEYPPRKMMPYLLVSAHSPPTAVTLQGNDLESLLALSSAVFKHYVLVLFTMWTLFSSSHLSFSFSIYFLFHSLSLSIYSWEKCRGLNVLRLSVNLRVVLCHWGQFSYLIEQFDLLNLQNVILGIMANLAVSY